AYHTFGFDWQQNYISYYVDGVKVYTGTQEIPSTAGKIMMNLWPGITVDSWLGAYDGRTPLSAYYEYARYSKDGYTPPSATPTQTNTPTPTRTNTPTSTNTPTNMIIVEDVNGDRTVNMADVILLAVSFNAILGDSKFNIKCDINKDNVINMSDVIQIALKFNKVY
ncbi:MAG: family 16 glycosylhydrolase, partial [Bacillota bacterium]|nr:family 16 glycosylhydrolase [Bacillota bacterium]